jgi:hypothetical protein
MCTFFRPKAALAVAVPVLVEPSIADCRRSRLFTFEFSRAMISYDSYIIHGLDVALDARHARTQVCAY